MSQIARPVTAAVEARNVTPLQSCAAACGATLAQASTPITTDRAITAPPPRGSCLAQPQEQLAHIRGHHPQPLLLRCEQTGEIQLRSRWSSDGLGAHH